MKRSREESQHVNNNKFVDQVPSPCLNLPLTKSPELINLVETYLKEHYPCPPQQTESSKTSAPPKSHEKLKAMNFPIAMIQIGQWTYAATNPDDIVAKLYFAKKKLIWEFLDHGGTETNMPRLKQKIEIQWGDVSSFEESINSRDETGILQIELRKRPTFFIETNPQAGKHTQWKQMDQDFTGNEASTCRRHILHFHPGILQKNLEKLMSDSFWSKLYEVPFPLHEGSYFDMDFPSNNNTNNNSSRYIPSQVNVNNVPLHHYSQGIGCVGVGEGNVNMATQFCANYGWQNSYSQANSQNNTPNELFGTQAIPPLSQVIDVQRNFTGSRYSNLMSQDESQIMQNRRELLLESYAYALPETQTNSMMIPPHMNITSMNPPVGSYLSSTLLQEDCFNQYTQLHGNFQGEEILHTEYTHLDGNFQIDDNKKIPRVGH